jgi:hypothetical protein
MSDVVERWRAILAVYAETAPPAYHGCAIAFTGVSLIHGAVELARSGAAVEQLAKQLGDGIRQVQVGLSMLQVDPDFPSPGLESYFNAQTALAEELRAALKSS